MSTIGGPERRESILLLNQYAGSPRLGMEFRPHWMASQWLGRGHSVEVTAGSYSHLRAANPTVRAMVSREVVEGVPYTWLRTNRYKGNGAGRLASMLQFAAGVRLAEASRVDRDLTAVVASSTHPFDIRPARDLARRRGAKFVYEVHDLWPLSPMLLGGHSPKHPLMRWMQREEDLACREADLVVSILPGTLPYLESRGLTRDRWVCVPNGVMPTVAAQRLSPDVQARIARLRSTYPVLVGYVGTVGLANRVDSLIAAADDLAASGVGVVVMGGGPQRDEIDRLARSRRNVLLLDAAPKAQALSVIEELDIAYIGLADSPLFEFGISPNKLFDYMLAGKPVVCAIASTSNPVVESGCGRMVRSGEPEAIAEAIIGMATLTHDERVALGRRGRLYVLQHHLQDSLAEEFLDALRGREVGADVS
jgi:glycosyltransferase involved in cell wall biosynthesis